MDEDTIIIQKGSERPILNIQDMEMTIVTPFTIDASSSLDQPNTEMVLEQSIDKIIFDDTYEDTTNIINEIHAEIMNNAPKTNFISTTAPEKKDKVTVHDIFGLLNVLDGDENTLKDQSVSQLECTRTNDKFLNVMHMNEDVIIKNPKINKKFIVTETIENLQPDISATLQKVRKITVPNSLEITLTKEIQPSSSQNALSSIYTPNTTIKSQVVKRQQLKNQSLTAKTIVKKEGPVRLPYRKTQIAANSSSSRSTSLKKPLETELNLSYILKKSPRILRKSGNVSKTAQSIDQPNTVKSISEPTKSNITVPVPPTLRSGIFRTNSNAAVVENKNILHTPKLKKKPELLKFVAKRNFDSHFEKTDTIVKTKEQLDGVLCINESTDTFSFYNNIDISLNIQSNEVKKVAKLIMAEITENLTNWSMLYLRKSCNYCIFHSIIDKNNSSYTDKLVVFNAHTSAVKVFLNSVHQKHLDGIYDLETVKDLLKVI